MVEVAAFVAGWFTPTSLFVLLNIVIATIFFTNHHSNSSKSSAAANHQYHTETTNSAHPPQLFRAPSLFSRVTSFNFNSYTHHSDDQPATNHLGPDYPARPDIVPSTPPAFSRAPSLLSRVTSFNFYRAHNMTVSAPDAAHESKMVSEGESETETTKVGEGWSREEGAGKSRDEEKKVSEGKEEDKAVGGGGGDARESQVAQKKAVRQKKVGGKKAAKALLAGETALFRGAHDEEVDTKADDFINKFKQQLKMQRLESLLRYRSPAT